MILLLYKYNSQKSLISISKEQHSENEMEIEKAYRTTEKIKMHHAKMLS